MAIFHKFFVCLPEGIHTDWLPPSSFRLFRIAQGRRHGHTGGRGGDGHAEAKDHAFRTGVLGSTDTMEAGHADAGGWMSTIRVKFSPIEKCDDFIL